MAGLFSYLENALEKMDEQAAGIAQGTAGGGTGTDAPGVTLLPPPGAVDDELVKRRAELEERKRAKAAKEAARATTVADAAAATTTTPPTPTSPAAAAAPVPVSAPPRPLPQQPAAPAAAPSPASSDPPSPSPPASQRDGAEGETAATSTAAVPLPPTPPSPSQRGGEGEGEGEGESREEEGTDGAAAAAAAAAVPDVDAEEFALLQGELSLVQEEKSAVERRVVALERLVTETQERTHKQISGLLESKEALEAEYRAAAERRDTADRQLEVDKEGFLEQLRGRDSLITELRRSTNERFEAQDANVRRIEDAEARAATLDEELGAARTVATVLQERAAALEAEQGELQRELEARDDDARTARALQETRAAEARAATAELERYKTRAARMLLEKDKEIERLQEGGGGGGNAVAAAAAGGGGGGGGEEAGDAVRLLQAADGRVAELEAALERARLEERGAAAERATEAAAAREEMADVKSLLDNYRATAESLQGSVASLQKQCFDGQQAAVEARAALEEDLRRKELLVQKLERRVAEKSEGDAQAEVAQRCRHLSESLMEKQAVLETKTLELDQARLRVQTLQQSIRDMERLAPMPGQMLPGASSGGTGPSAGLGRRGGAGAGYDDLEAQVSYDALPYQVWRVKKARVGGGEGRGGGIPR